MSISRHQAVGAYQRWEPPSFGQPGQTPTTPEPAPPEPPPLSEPSQDIPAIPIHETEPEPAIQLPTAADIEAMFEDARHEGFDAGFTEGTELARQQAARLADLAHCFEEALTRLDQDIAEEVVALAVEIARKMVGQSLVSHPEAINETVRSALLQLPQVQLRIYLHPEDAALVREHLAEQSSQFRHQLIEDNTMSRGGCRVSTPGGEIDATLETRWRRILEGLGRTDTAWQGQI